VEHHLFDDSDKELRVRPAKIEDASAITRLSTQELPLSDAARFAAQRIVEERLGIASGDDYFTIVAERKPSAEIVGWLTGGGCRGQEFKGWGELYALSSEQFATNIEIDEALLGVALHALEAARFSGVTILLERADSIRRELLEDLGFIAEHDDTDNEPAMRDVLIRYSFEFAAS